MKEPKRIPLTNHPRSKEPEKKLLSTNYDIQMIDDVWEKVDIKHAPPIFARKNENHQQNNKTSIQQLESDKTN